MTTFHIYSDNSLEYLGRLEAVDLEAAHLLAGQIWRLPLRITTWRIQLNRVIAA